MTISSVGTRSSLMVQSIIDMRAQLDDLQRQLATGKQSTSYAGIGIDRGLAVGLRTQLSAMSGYADTIDNIGVRINLQQSSLTLISGIASSVKAASQGSFTIDTSGQAAAQRTAASQLDEVLSVLNSRAGDRYLFSGRAVDTPAIDTLDHILNGNGAQAGFKQVLADRNQADLGSNGLGRLVIPPASGTQVTLSEDVAGSPFGFKLAGVSTLNGATVTGPTGFPPGITIDVTSNPSPGDSITFSFNLPDGTSEQLTLGATTASPQGDGAFTVGTSPADTAANLQAALMDGVAKLASTSLAAASALAAADNFFDVDAGQLPLRVAGPPFDTSTSLISGTAANTVTWYTGEMGTDPARGTAVAQVDDSLTVAYGARANEQSITSVIKYVAVFATMTYSTSDPNAAARFAEVNQRVSTALAGTNGEQKIPDIVAELAHAQTTMTDASQRQQERQVTLETLVDSVEGVSPEQAASQILALQTRLQASLQATAMLYQLSLANYL